MEGFDITKILNKQTTAQTENAVTEDFKEIKLDYGKIVITGKNKYSMNWQQESKWRAGCWIR